MLQTLGIKCSGKGKRGFGEASLELLQSSRREIMGPGWARRPREWRGVQKVEWEGLDD